MKHPLSRALHGAGLGLIDVAVQLCVDPKTVQRWLAGRVPYPRHRTALCRLTGWPEPDLWPQLARPLGPDLPTDEIQAVYPHRSDIPADTWRRFFTRARRAIDIVSDDCLFLAEDTDIVQVLRDKAQAGVRVRATLGEPNRRYLDQYATEVDGGGTMTSRVRNAFDQLQALAEEAGVHVRLHNSVLYYGAYRADDDILVNTHAYGITDARSPVLHLRQLYADGLAAVYLHSVERVWNKAHAPMCPVDKRRMPSISSQH